ncbi:histone acetyltransferases subunit 3-domain-containing protein [Leptodontidium sp. 2 PMI_412]|nr:histone acetyltransferases subunit 3-domain-containing protein [Leptodontidium sp. MPI-SDFR-AT-0119]KAH9216284.1 histone acetyltransferases subunit 3-domain-containing protein [Leptodontidium sp. 2 PMI_412]
MPPALPSQKGTGKKGRDRQSRSRNTTPSIMSQSDPEETAYLRIPLQNFQTDEGIDNYGSGSAGSKEIPSSKDLEGLLERLGKLVNIADARSSVSDRGMRAVVGLRKERLEEIETERRDEERKERLKKDALDEEERGRNKASKMKKRKDASTAREERPLAHGAHGLAAQDGTHHPERSSPLHEKKVARKVSRERDNDSASSSLSPVAVATPTETGMDIDKDDDEDSSSDEHQPPPAPAVPHLQTFGDDPNTFPDPTIYEIRPVKPGMSVQEMNEIYSVASFPEHDLEEYIPATPPEKDFSNAKPTNQVQFNTFSTYAEPYFRPYTEEDLAFLRERGDRIAPFVIPRRGKKHYTEVWAEEDGALSVDSPQQARDKFPANQARGDIENMNDAVGETDQISAGPILSRLLATMRPEHRAPAEEKTNGVNGEVDMNADLNNDLFGDAVQPPSDTPSVPPATFMTDSNSEAWKKATHPKLDHPQVDERIKQELRHIGFLPPDTEPDYDAHYDDEIAARLRYLQGRLKEVSIMNGARKARITDLAKERMAHQEFTTINEDLDGQVQTAYLKRTRTLGKSKKAKRPGGAGGGSHFVSGSGSTGMARPGIGDNTKILMERRKKWIDTIGGVLDKDANQVRRSGDPGSSIFKPEDMADLIRKEKESWDDEAEED